MNSTHDPAVSAPELPLTDSRLTDPHLTSSQLQSDSFRSAGAAVALATVLLLWAGMVINNAFVAGVKFATPSMTRAVGMDVGRTVFSAFNKVELVCCAVSFGLLFLARPFRRIPRLIGVLLPLIWIIVGLQTAFLLPMLVERALLFMQGHPLPNSPVHRLYTSSELIKLFALIAAGVGLIRQLRQPNFSA